MRQRESKSNSIKWYNWKYQCLPWHVLRTAAASVSTCNVQLWHLTILFVYIRNSLKFWYSGLRLFCDMGPNACTLIPNRDYVCQMAALGVYSFIPHKHRTNEAILIPRRAALLVCASLILNLKKVTLNGIFTPFSYELMFSFNKWKKTNDGYCKF